MTLGHVLWIGGPPGSGKTTIATRIARRHGLRLYSADAHTWEHRDRAIRDGNPTALRWEAMTPEERWVSATPAEMLEMSLHRERGPMVVDDLRRLPTSPLVVAEGTPVSPELVASGAADRSRAVWLLPTDELQRARLEKRDLPRGPQQLYVLLAAEIERHASEHDVAVLPVDGSRTVDETLAVVEDLFAEALAEGPRADTASERQALLRYANATIVSQYRAYFARPWTTGDAESIVLSFSCECGEPNCEAVVELAVAAFPDEPLLADDHG